MPSLPVLLLLSACTGPAPSDPDPEDPCAFRVLEAVTTEEEGDVAILFGLAGGFSVEAGARVQSPSDAVRVVSYTVSADPEGTLLAVEDYYAPIEGWDAEQCTGAFLTYAFVDPELPLDQVCGLDGRTVQLEMTVEPWSDTGATSPAQTLSMEATARVGGVGDEPCAP